MNQEVIRMYSIDYFESLCQQFPEWDALKAHVESNEGGNLRVIPQEGTPYVAIRSVKGKGAAATFRSVIWNTATNRPVCYAPPKALEGRPPTKTMFSAVEDFVDGFMVNVFVVASDPTTLQIATRTQIGGNNRFYSDKTFATLFEEALAATPIRTMDALKMHMREAMASNAAAFASFVVQHPEHRIVAKVQVPSLNVIHIGKVTPTGLLQVSETASEWPDALQRFQVSRYPVKQFHTEAEIDDLMRRTAVNRGFRWQGLVFKDGVGARWRLRSPSYQMLRTLRGAEATTLDRFLRLRREGTVMEYLKHYGEERKTMWGHEETLRQRTTDVLKAYDVVHKAHAAKFADLPVAYKPAVHLLHVEYLNVLRPKGHTVLLRNAIEVVNGLKDFEQKRLMDAEAFIAPASTVTAATETAV